MEFRFHKVWKWKNLQIVTGLSFHRLAESLMSRDQGEAASDTAAGTVLLWQTGRKPHVPRATLPVATHCGWPAATPGWAQPCVQCRCGSGIGPAPSNTARHGFILPDFRLPAGMPKSPSGHCSGESCVCSEQLQAIYFAGFFFLLMWTTSGCQRQMGLRRAGWALTGVCTFGNGALLAFTSHPPLGSLEA